MSASFRATMTRCSKSIPRYSPSAVDRVSTISSEKGRAVKLNIATGQLVLSVNNPDSGSAEEEIAADYEAEPLDIGFNSRYLLDIASQIKDDSATVFSSPMPVRRPSSATRRRAGTLCADADAGVTAGSFNVVAGCSRGAPDKWLFCLHDSGLRAISRGMPAISGYRFEASAAALGQTARDRRPARPSDAHRFPQLCRTAA